MSNKILVIGSGEWGKALAGVFGAEVLRGRADSTKIEADIVVIATDSQSVRGVLQKHQFGDCKIVIAAKGLELGSLKLLSAVAAECLHNDVAVLSGPNFAAEIAAGLPAVATIASEKDGLAEELALILGRKNFRLYASHDIVGVQVAGALKNVIAIACGIAHGKKLGENARAAIVTRALAEIARLTAALDGKPETLLQPAGVGDLFLSCSSTTSRNFRFGEMVATVGVPDVSEFLSEGYFACAAVKNLAEQLKIEMPICNSVYEVIYNKQDVYEQINQLLERPRTKA